MTNHLTGTREEWLAARLGLLQVTPLSGLIVPRPGRLSASATTTTTTPPNRRHTTAACSINLCSCWVRAAADAGPIS